MLISLAIRSRTPPALCGSWHFVSRKSIVSTPCASTVYWSHYQTRMLNASPQHSSYASDLVHSSYFFSGYLPLLQCRIVYWQPFLSFQLSNKVIVAISSIPPIWHSSATSCLVFPVTNISRSFTFRLVSLCALYTVDWNIPYHLGNGWLMGLFKTPLPSFFENRLEDSWFQFLGERNDCVGV